MEFYPACRFRPPHRRLMRRLVCFCVGIFAINASINASISVSTVRGEDHRDRDLAFFEKEVRPVLIQYCYGCHSAEAKIKGGLRLDTREGLIRGGDSGSAIIAGDSEASLLIEAVNYKNRDLQMPPKNPLPPAAVAALKQWIESGAADPRGETVDDVSSEVQAKGMSVDDGRKFWSFRPVIDPPVPDVRDRRRIRNPIDAFVFSRLEDQGLAPAPQADKVTLIRRVTQNLIGLPPSPEEIDAFLDDDSSDAWDTVVDRLLNSPHYGVRWGRHWLDVARYADSNGLDENLGYGQAWRYRDYVVDSFNADKPFDRFLIEQVAGDLLPDANRQTKTATGFLALGAKVLAEPDRQKLEMDIIDEQIDMLGKSFMGMTLGCVRCHDHKFDPIMQTDYYALAAIFKSTKTLGDSNQGAIKHWYEHSFATEEERSQLKEIDAKIAEKKKAASSFKNAVIAKLRSDARAKVVDYLVAAAQFDVATPLTRVAEIAEPLGLHPRILHHCRMHLDFHGDDPLFTTWHRFAASGQHQRIRDHYQALFQRAESALADARKENPKTKVLSDPRLEAARAAIDDVTGLLAVPSKEEFAFDAETLAEYRRLMDAARTCESNSADETAAMGVCDGEVVSRLPIHIRGSYKNLGESVRRDFPLVMRLSSVRPVFPIGESGRLELARWMADTRHPLTARVMVNRIWSWHFGVGLVRTTENFGRLGDRPSHPLLLDWLAMRFMEGGWSIKDLHRLILQSEVYRLASSHEQAERYIIIDPENRLLWKANLRRLEAEQIRDSILAVAGRLDRKIGGKTLPLRNRQFVFNHTSEDHTKYDSLRRALYLPVIRNNLYAFFSQFDYPDPTMPTGARSTTVIAPQNLLLMNYQLVMDSADAFAKATALETTDDLQRIALAYRRTLGREPEPDETERALRFVADLSSVSGREDTIEKDRAWSLFCQSLMASNEFIYLR
jgi:hypothetical protein